MKIEDLPKQRTMFGFHRTPVSQSGRTRMLPIEANHVRITNWRNLIALKATRNAAGDKVLYGIFQANNLNSDVKVAPKEELLNIPYPRHLAAPEQIDGLIKVDIYPSQGGKSGMENYYLLHYEIEIPRSERLTNHVNFLKIDEAQKKAALKIIEDNKAQIDGASAKEVGTDLALKALSTALPSCIQPELEELWQRNPLHESDRFAHVPMPWFDIDASRWKNVFKYTPLWPIYFALKHPLVNFTINLFRLYRYNQCELWLNLIKGIESITQPRYLYKSPFWRYVTTFPLNLPLFRHYLNHVFQRPADQLSVFQKLLKGHIFHIHEMEITNYFPTNIAYPQHKGWLSSNNVFRLKEDYTISDLVDLVKYLPTKAIDWATGTRFWVGPNQDKTGTLTWSPEAPKNKTGWREVKNAGLGLLKIDGVEEQVVVPFTALPGHLKNQLHARAVIEITPLEGNKKELEVVAAQMNESSPDEAAKVDYFLKPNASLRKLAEAQGCKWSDNFLTNEDFVKNLKLRVLPNKKDGLLTRATNFNVEVEYGTNDQANSGKFVVPGEYFVDLEDKALLQNPTQDLDDLSQIYQREDNHYNLQTEQFKPMMVLERGYIKLRLTRVKRTKIKRPQELNSALKALGKTDQDLSSILFSVPTLAAKINDKFWVPLSLTTNVKSRFLDNVPALQYNYIFSPRKVRDRNPDEQAQVLNDFDAKLQVLYQKLETNKELPVKITQENGAYTLEVEGTTITIDGSELLDQHAHPLLQDPRMKWAVESIVNNGLEPATEKREWNMYLFRANDAVVLGIRKLHTHCGKALPKDLPYFMPDFNNVYLHFVARQTLLFDDDIPGSFAADIRDSFFYGRGANTITDAPNDWQKTTSGMLAELFHFYAGLQAGERHVFNQNGVPSSSPIENGTRYAASTRTLHLPADIQGGIDGTLGGVFRNLFNRHYKKLVNYGRPLGFVQAVGEDEELKLAVFLLIGGVLGYDFVDPSLAIQEDGHAANDVQDNQKYNATTHLVEPPFKRVLLETYHGRLMGNRPLSFSRGHIFTLFMQATWYYISYAEKNRKFAPILFLLSAGYLLPLPVDRTTFMQIFLYDLLVSVFGYQFLRTVQGYGFKRSFIDAPAKYLAFLGADSQGIQRFFSEKWEYAYFVPTRSVTGGGSEMPLHSKNLLAWYQMGEAAAVASAGLHAASGITMKAGEGTSEGLFINAFWTSYALMLTRNGIKWQNDFERYELFKNAEMGKIPTFNLSSLPATENLSDTKLLQKQLLTWRSETIQALSQLDAHVKEYSKDAKLDKKLHNFLRSEYRQSIMAMLQRIDMGIYILARQLGGTAEGAENRTLAFGLLQVLCESPFDQAVYRLAVDAIRKVELSKDEKKNLPKLQKTLLAEIETYSKKAKEQKPADVPSEVDKLLGQIYGTTIKDDAAFAAKFNSFVSAISAGRNHAEKQLKELKGVLAEMRKPQNLKAALGALLNNYTGNYLCRLLLKSWLKKEPNLPVKEALIDKIAKLKNPKEIQDEGNKLLTLIDTLKKYQVISNSDGNTLRKTLNSKFEEALNNLDVNELFEDLKKEANPQKRASIINNLLETLKFASTEDKGENIFLIRKRAEAIIAKVKPLLTKTEQMPDSNETEVEAKINALNSYDPLMQSLLDQKYLAEERHRPTLWREKVLYYGARFLTIGLRLLTLGLVHVKKNSIKKKFPFNSTFNAELLLAKHNKELDHHLDAVNGQVTEQRAKLVTFTVKNVDAVFNGSDTPAVQYENIQAILKFINKHALSEVFEDRAIYPQMDSLLHFAANDLDAKFTAIRHDLGAGTKAPADIAKDFDALTKKALDLGFVNILFKDSIMDLKRQIMERLK